MALLNMKGVSKAFGETVILSGVDLSLWEGEIVSLIGPSGCGKSSLLRIVAGLDREYTGQVQIGGAALTGPSPDVGVVFQEPRLFPWLNVRRNIAFALKERDDARVAALAAQVGLEHALDRLPKELSGGMAQRCAIARALITRPRLLLMDEPFSALDAFTRMHLQDLILSIWQQYRTSILLVTHDIDEAVYLSDRVVVMSDRPASVKAVIDIELPRPRERRSEELVALTRRVLAELDVAFERQPYSRARRGPAAPIAAPTKGGTST